MSVYSLVLPIGQSGTIISDTPPSSPAPGSFWLDSTTGQLFTFYDGFWVDPSTAGSSSGSGVVTLSQLLGILGDGTQINPAYIPPAPPLMPNINQITEPTHTLNTDDVGGYSRLTSPGAKTVLVPLSGGSFVVEQGQVITVRNAANTGNITINPEVLGVLINYAPGDNVVQPQNSAQLLCVSANNWDLL